MGLVHDNVWCNYWKDDGALFGGMVDYERAFMFLHYLSHFQTEFGDSKSYELLEHF